MSATQFVCKKKHAGKKKPTNALFFSEAVLNDIFLAKVDLIFKMRKNSNKFQSFLTYIVRDVSYQ